VRNLPAKFVTCDYADSPRTCSATIELIVNRTQRDYERRAVPVTDNMAGYDAALRYSTRGATITHKQVIIWLISTSEQSPDRAGWSGRVGRLMRHNCRAQVSTGGRGIIMKAARAEPLDPGIERR